MKVSIYLLGEKVSLSGLKEHGEKFTLELEVNKDHELVGRLFKGNGVFKEYIGSIYDAKS